MKKSDIIKQLTGNAVTEENMKKIDCYVRPQLGIFVTTSEADISQIFTARLSYMIIIYFEQTAKKRMHYRAKITSPGVSYPSEKEAHCYCVMIEKEYFDKRYMMYAESVPVFSEHAFEMCSDILKALNIFAFEYSKSMMNSDITLDAQSEIITHWIIRSILGETMDLRAVSDDYSIARAQHYMEQHYMDNITVAKLAALGYVSESCFNRRFKKEIGITPIEYLIEIRIKHAKILLRRKSIPITEIAMRCGFGSSAHLSSCFQNRLGISPSEYRNRYD